MLIIFYSLLFLLIIYCFGLLLLNLFEIKFKNLIDLIISSVFLGYGFFSLFVFLYGNYFTLNSLIIIIFVLSGFISFFFVRKTFIKSISQIIVEVKEIKIEFLTINGCLVFLLISSFSFVALLNFLNCFAPPSDGDSLNFHLSIPKYYLKIREIVPVVYTKDLLSPTITEMWNLICIILDLDILAQVLQFIMGIFTSLVLYRLVSARMSSRSAIFVFALYYINPKIIMLSSIAKPDIVYFGYLFLSLHFILMWQERKDINYYYLSALFTGFTLATKYHGLFWALSIGLLVLILIFYDKRFQLYDKIKIIFLYVLMAFIIVFPFYLRNFIFTGDPIWPFGWYFFESNFWSQALNDKYSSWQQGPGDSFWHFITILWNVTLNQEYWAGGYRIPYLPIQLALLPGVFFIRSHLTNKQLKFYINLILISFIFYTLWFFTYQQLRYFLPIMSILLIPCSQIFWIMIDKNYFRIVFTAFIIPVLLFSIAFSILNAKQYLPVVFGFEKKYEFLDYKVTFYKDIMWINNNIKDGSIIFFNHLKPYYLNKKYKIPPSYMNEEYKKMSADDFYEYLLSEDISYIFQPNDAGPRFKKNINVLINENKLNIFYENDKAKRIISRGLRQYENVGLKLYKVLR
jgi:hypothetical protein